MKQQDILIILARSPVYGKVKTRLAAAIGTAEALEVYRQLLQHTLEVAGNVPSDKIVFYSDESVPDEATAPGFARATQYGADLGARMENAFTHVFRQGYEKAVMIGTDCPAMGERTLAAAFEALHQHDVVIGPAYDGGYYLLGMKQVHHRLFDNIPWSTPAVFEETVTICRYDGLRYLLLPTLHDVDKKKDLPHLAKIKQHG